MFTIDIDRPLSHSADSDSQSQLIIIEQPFDDSTNLTPIHLGSTSDLQQFLTRSESSGAGEGVRVHTITSTPPSDSHHTSIASSHHQVSQTPDDTAGRVEQGKSHSATPTPHSATPTPHSTTPTHHQAMSPRPSLSSPHPIIPPIESTPSRAEVFRALNPGKRSSVTVIEKLKDNQVILRKSRDNLARGKLTRTILFSETRVKM